MATFLEQLLFSTAARKDLISTAATFSEEPILHNILFHKRYYFTDILLFTAALSIYQLLIK